MRKIGPRLRSATDIILTKALASASLGPARSPSAAEGHFHPRKNRSPSEVDGPILKRSQERSPSAAEGPILKRSQERSPSVAEGHFHQRKNRSPSVAEGDDPSEAEGICLANDDNSFSFHRNIATKQIAIFKCLQFTTPFKYNK